MICINILNFAFKTDFHVFSLIHYSGHSTLLPDNQSESISNPIFIAHHPDHPVEKDEYSCWMFGVNTICCFHFLPLLLHFNIFTLHLSGKLEKTHEKGFYKKYNMLLLCKIVTNRLITCLTLKI